jgi:glutamyl-Q tRNA(Asp) synthetase
LQVAGTTRFTDRLRAEVVEDLERQTGDFVLRRADGLWAYQLAVVVDDAEQQITDVVRGSDLLSSTARQIYLQKCLGLPVPAYLHVPVVVDAQGCKLSKQTGAAPLDDARASASLRQAAAALGHALPAELSGCPPTDFWNWLAAHWDITRIPAVDEVRLN